MPHITLLTAQQLLGTHDGDQLLAKELEALGCRTSIKAWDSFQDEGEDLLVIRTTWDYTEKLDEFLNFCSTQQARLLNPYEVVRWNCNKRYLQELGERGLEIVPMHIVSSPEELREAVADLACEKAANQQFVAKPLVSASAKGLVSFGPEESQLPAITEEMIVQRLLPQIRQGEVSLMYFGGTYEFAVLKTPKKGEFRVQHEFGGSVRLYQPTAELRQLADQAVALIPAATAYVRVDIVPKAGVIELECIEPELFLGLYPPAARACAKAILAAASSR